MCLAVALFPNSALLTFQSDVSPPNLAFATKISKISAFTTTKPSEHSMFCGIDTSLLDDVPSVPALLSAAEMLQSAAPVISGSFVRLAVLLCDSHFSQNPPASAADAAYLKLKYLAASMEPASTLDLDRFANMLIARIPESATAPELRELVYFCRAAHCIHGPISEQTISQLKALEREFATGTQGSVRKLSETVRVSSSPVQAPASLPEVPKSDRATDLIEVARYAFSNGSYKTAYMAMNAALAMLQK